MRDAFICDAIRTPIGRFGGKLSSIRADDLAAIPIRALAERNPGVDWSEVDDVILGCANQAGEDNRNVARMALLLAGLPQEIPGSTINRLCGSGLDAIGSAARAIRAGDAELLIAGGVESMSRAPYVLGKAEGPFSRTQKIEDTTIGWRFINPAMKTAYGVESMPETAENLAQEWGISREDQDAFALSSQRKSAAAQTSGRFASEIVAVKIDRKRDRAEFIVHDEHPRADTTLDSLAALRPIARSNGTVTAGNSSGVNDGAAALLIASEAAAKTHGLVPRARILGMAASGVAPRIMGIGPVSATARLLAAHNLNLNQMAVIEINEAFAAQTLAVLRDMHINPSDPRINPNGGAIALGHPLGMSGARIVMTAVWELMKNSDRYALASMCVGVGQGLSVLLERV